MIRLRAGGEGNDRGWDGWMASPTQWTWVWVNSRSWWWTGRPGMLYSSWGHKESDTTEWLNWTNWVKEISNNKDIFYSFSSHSKSFPNFLAHFITKNSTHLFSFWVPTYGYKTIFFALLIWGEALNGIHHNFHKNKTWAIH